jgi:Arc/MetJ-type ribon-helix-helix transcriptional regulator
MSLLFKGVKMSPEMIEQIEALVQTQQEDSFSSVVRRAVRLYLKQQNKDQLESDRPF